MTELRKMIQDLEKEIIEIRRALHQIPEIGLKEEKTSQWVAQYLEKIPGMEVTTGVAGTGVIGLLKTGTPGKTLLIRADMDALPVREDTGLSFASEHGDMMHACGHDGHMTMVLATARILSRIKERFTGAVKFMFQPAEEWPGGAKPMIDQGLLENPKPDYAVAGHLWPSLPQGTLGIKPGILMSAASMFTIKITGQGGHGAMPHLCVDALDTAGQVVNALQRVVSRKLNPLTPSVVTVGSFHAGSAPNTIPQEAVLKGTTRTFDRQVWQNYPELLEPVIKGVCDSMGASYEFSFDPGYPPLENDPEMVNLLKKTAAKVVPRDRIHEPEPTMGAEDMAFVLERIKGCYFFLGSGFEGCAPLHSPKFDFRESVLLTGVETFVRFTLDMLG
ncbi:M20 metallopeptidase family protein [Desulfospira joergensenii]|uniref:M20 metallopeptidase family protein n=1 Tax=Desulfospira joergensenii TaxID=53329 RepID=UPI0003B648D0|nr:amidohydrolase [Desulfospira joergensenii]